MNILLVEDEVGVREELCSALASKGFAVRTANNGLAAIAELTLQSGGFKAVVIGVRLSDNIQAWEISRVARAMIPNVPVVYLGTHLADDWSTCGVPRSVLLAKPIDVPHLVLTLNDLLATRLRDVAHDQEGDRAAPSDPGELYAEGRRRTFVRALSDADLVRYFGLLSDARYITNTPALAVLEAEVVRRKLPTSTKH